MKKVALYCRISTDRQTNLNQKNRLIEYTTAQGWDYDMFEEVQSTSNKLVVRNELLLKARRGAYDAVVVYKLDRFSRSSTDLILTVKELCDKGVAFISVTDNLDFSTAHGQLHFQILAAFSQFEKSLIAERTRLGIARAKSQGKHTGRPAGKKDSRKRRTGGYILRWAKERQVNAEKTGVYKPIEDYLG